MRTFRRSRWLKALEFTAFFFIYTIAFPLLLTSIYGAAPEIYKSVIDSFGGSIPLIGAAAWLVQTLVVFELDREKFIFQTRFARIDQDRAQAIEEIHMHLVQSIEGTTAIINNFDALKKLSERSEKGKNKFPGYEKELDHLQRQLKSNVDNYVPVIRKTRYTVAIKGLYLPPDIETNIQSLLATLQGALVKVWGEEANDVASYLDDFEEAKNIVHVKLPEMIDELKREFRSLLGDSL
jgi:hypothetical protein